jgi:hypothetical protein
MMPLDDGAADRQPNAHPIGLGGVERFEALVHALSVQAHAHILDAQAHSIAFVSLGSDQHLSWAILDVAHRVCRVQEEIQNDLLQLNAIAYDRREIVGELEACNQAASLQSLNDIAMTSRVASFNQRVLCMVHYV